MKIELHEKSKSLDNFGLDPNVAINVKTFTKNYRRFLKNHKTVKLKDILSLKKVESVSEGDLVIDTLYFKNLRAWIVTKEKQKNKRKSFNKATISDHRISSQYLLWCLNQKEITDYLSLFAKGGTITFIPILALKEIEIPLPQKGQQQVSQEAEIKSEGIYKQAIRENLLEEYKQCRENNLTLSALVIAGAIAEAILSEYLIEEGVRKELLKNKTLGGLTDFFEVRSSSNNNLVQNFKELANARNHIHINKLISQGVIDEEWAKPAFNSFDKVIKEFGL